MRACASVRARACVRACECVCAFVCVCMRGCSRVYVLLTYLNQCLYCTVAVSDSSTIRRAEWVQTSRTHVTNVCRSVRFYRWMVLFGIEGSVAYVGVCLVVDLWKRAA